jgi:hypothetical protein
MSSGFIITFYNFYNFLTHLQPSPISWEYPLKTRTVLSVCLKGPWQETFDLCFFFSSNNSPQAPDTRVKAFLNMASYLRSKSTKLFAQLCHWHFCHMHSGVIVTAVICTAVSLTPLWYAQQCHWQNFCQLFFLWISGSFIIYLIGSNNTFNSKGLMQIERYRILRNFQNINLLGDKILE